MSFADLPISRKLTAAFAAVILACGGASALVFANMRAIQIAAAEDAESREVLADAADVKLALLEEQNAMRGYVASGDAQFLKKFEDHRADYAKAVEALRTADDHPDHVKRMAALDEAEAKFETEAKAMLAVAADPATRPQAEAVIGEKARLTAVREALKATTDTHEGLLAQRSAAQAKAFASAYLGFFIGGGVALAIALAMAWALTRSIARPVVGMTGAMGRLAAGDNQVDVPAVGRRDEIGAMAQAVLHFKDAAVEKARLEGQTETQRRAAEDERRRHEAERAAAAEAQAAVVAAVAGGLARV
ncbi:CHASE3 domain-containing protein, partial [Caulobacter sp. 17J65-9]|uniref:CHASE3 domain-containing protein n=1 Tax=Caulobacter sp. 17J65-9 TaxID=2709382 RepID=UPI0013CAA4E3